MWKKKEEFRKDWLIVKNLIKKKSEGKNSKKIKIY